MIPNNIDMAESSAHGQMFVNSRTGVCFYYSDATVGTPSDCECAGEAGQCTRYMIFGQHLSIVLSKHMSRNVQTPNG